MSFTDAERPLLDVVCAVIVRNGKEVLVARRKTGKVLAGCWEFPGGKVETGETPEIAIRREIAEELGIHIHVGKELNDNVHHYEAVSIRLIPFICTAQTEPEQSDDHDLLVWVPLGKLEQLDWAPADVPIIDQIERELSN